MNKSSIIFKLMMVAMALIITMGACNGNKERAIALLKVKKTLLSILTESSPSGISRKTAS